MKATLQCPPTPRPPPTPHGGHLRRRQRAAGAGVSHAAAPGSAASTRPPHSSGFSLRRRNLGRHALLRGCRLAERATAPPRRQRLACRPPSRPRTGSRRCTGVVSPPVAVSTHQLVGAPQACVPAPVRARVQPPPPSQRLAAAASVQSALPSRLQASAAAAASRTCTSCGRARRRQRLRSHPSRPRRHPCQRPLPTHASRLRSTHASRSALRGRLRCCTLLAAASASTPAARSSAASIPSPTPSRHGCTASGRSAARATHSPAPPTPPITGWHRPPDSAASHAGLPLCTGRPRKLPGARAARGSPARGIPALHHLPTTAAALRPASLKRSHENLLQCRSRAPAAPRRPSAPPLPSRQSSAHRLSASRPPRSMLSASCGAQPAQPAASAPLLSACTALTAQQKHTSRHPAPRSKRPCQFPPRPAHDATMRGARNSCEPFRLRQTSHRSAAQRTAPAHPRTAAATHGHDAPAKPTSSPPCARRCPNPSAGAPTWPLYASPAHHPSASLLPCITPDCAAPATACAAARSAASSSASTPCALLLRPLRAHARRRVARSTSSASRRAPNNSTASRTAPAHKQTQMWQRCASRLRLNAQ
jgi:hypothetical protein